MKLFLLEPESGGAWFPYCDSRPVCELRAGVWLIRERWEGIAGVDGTECIFGPEHLRGFVEEFVPPVEGTRPLEGPAIVGRSTFAPTGFPPELTASAANLVHEGEVVGWWVPEGARWTPGEEFDEQVELQGIALRGSYDLISALEHLLEADAADFTQEGGDEIPEGSVVLGEPSEVVLLSAAVEPGVVFDVRRGAVVLERATYVRAGTRLEGPLYVGAGTEVLGGEIKTSSIGPRCKVRGEMAWSVFLGYANKAHDGYVGHSVVGRWANLGADTVTSNLKNTYGPVRVEVGSQRIETARTNLGSLIGDHVKTAIGTLFGTGTVVGVGANVFGWTRPPKFVPPLAWGDGGTIRRDAFIEIARRVLPRREVEVTPQVIEALGRIYDHAAARGGA